MLNIKTNVMYKMQSHTLSINWQTYTATGSLNFPSCWMRYIRSPPLTYSITKYSRS